jgi:hypothetical protein
MQLDQMSSRSSLKPFLSLYCWLLTFFRTVPRSMGFLMTARRPLCRQCGKCESKMEKAKTDRHSNQVRLICVPAGETPSSAPERRVLTIMYTVNTVRPTQWMLTVQPLSSLTMRSSVS